MNNAIKHHYKNYRAHQMNVWAEGGGTVTTYADGGKVEITYASAPYGEHAASALASAKRHIHFVKDLGETVKSYKKRSAAAKRGWKKRKAAA